MHKLVLFLLSLCFVCCTAFAEIPCCCDKTDYLCFIQLGDEGMAVELIQNMLVEQGYLAPNDDASIFDEKTLNAVIIFQQANELSPTGMMDDHTLTLLLWGVLPEELDEYQPDLNGSPVWIPTDGGEKYHREVNCRPVLFIILDPRLVSSRNALYMGIQPCKICHPTGIDTDLAYYQKR